jgi:hypothetical protein
MRFSIPQSFSDPPTDVISFWNHKLPVAGRASNPEYYWNRWQDDLRRRGFQL